MMAALVDVALAVLLGGAFASGLALLLSLLPRLRAEPLIVRVAPYIRDITMPRGVDLPEKSVHPLGIDIVPFLSRVRLLLPAVFGGEDELAQRLERSGWRIGPLRYRSIQRVAALGGLFGGAFFVALSSLGAGRFAAASLLLPPLFAIGGAFVCELLLSRSIRARAHRMEEELPTVLEFLALCLSAGAALFESVQRVASIGSGELGSELRRVVLAVRTGDTLADALAELARRVDVAPLTRAVDHLLVAIDRGSPLAHVLHAQADDARDGAKRALIESAGKKEIMMLLPLVFLILPLSILFAVFPGVAMLSIGFN